MNSFFLNKGLVVTNSKNKEEIEDALIKAGFSKVNTNHHETKPWITVIAEK